jgi:hypothetical protein
MPTDVNVRAARIVDLATSEEPVPDPRKGIRVRTSSIPLRWL